jgi:maltokinase
VTDVTPLHHLADLDAWDGLADALAPWVPRQRWFAGKARHVAHLDVADTAVLGDDEVLLVLVDVSYGDGGTERYLVPLAVGEPTIATVVGLPLGDATSSPIGRRVLGRAHLSEAAVSTTSGAVVRGLPVEGTAHVDLDGGRKMRVEQSNTSVVFGDELILKIFRRLEVGLNPDVELTRALTRAGFRYVPAQHGALRMSADGVEPTYLGVVSAFLHGAVEGWELATAEAASVLDGGPGTLVGSMVDLGRVVGRMHVVLRDALGAEEASPDDADGWSRAMQNQAARVLELAAERDPATTAAVLERSDDIISRFDGLADLGDLGMLVRTHGDLHLGQVLLHPDAGWQILDFEGEPARSLEERRRRQPPLRDVAGVLRSFDYAAASAALDPPSGLATWRDELRAAFLHGYRGAAEAEGLLPKGTWEGLLAAFELDKALYELGYELANRPDWVAIPVGGILRVLDRAGDHTTSPTDTRS